MGMRHITGQWMIYYNNPTECYMSTEYINCKVFQNELFFLFEFLLDQGWHHPWVSRSLWADQVCFPKLNFFPGGIPRIGPLCYLYWPVVNFEDVRNSHSCICNYFCCKFLLQYLGCVVSRMGNISRSFHIIPLTVFNQTVPKIILGSTKLICMFILEL